MARREEAIKLATSSFFHFLPDRWDDDDVSILSDPGRSFLDAVVGVSAARLLPALERLKAETEKGGGGSASVHEGKRGFRLHVEDGCGGVFAATWGRSEPDDETSPIDASFFRIDPDEPDYPYPERIASATILDREDRPAAFGHCTLEKFGVATRALRAFALETGVDTAPLPQNALEGSGMQRYSPFATILELDGGIAGEACLAAAARISAAMADRIMKRAESVFNETAEALRNEGAVWEKACLTFNDLDNYVTLVETGAATAIIHRNVSYISDWREYALLRCGDGKFGLYAMKDGTDDFSRFMEAMDGKGPPLQPIASVRGDRVETASVLDETGILSAAGYGLAFLREVIIAGDRGDAELVTDLSNLDTMMLHEDWETATEAPAP